MAIWYIVQAALEAIGVAFFVLGIIALIRGKITLMRGMATYGGAARMVVLLLLLVMPLTIGLRYAVAQAIRPPRGPMAYDPQARAFAELMDFFVVLGTLLIGFLAAMTVAYVCRQETPDDGKL